MIYKPKMLKVGFQARNGTFTGQLAYITYIDNKNVLRKETSWNSWRDKSIDPKDVENVPTEGFVLNKKVGDYRGGWNGRSAWIRVYDPRGFEFEITVNNLLYILENTDCIIGKGLTGKFVYAWDGKDLLLLPEKAPEYKDIMANSDLINAPEKILGKDLVLGGTYMSNVGKQLIYLGRADRWSDYYSWMSNHNQENKGKHYWFLERGKHNTNYITPIKSLSKRIIKTVDKTPVYDFASLIDILECDPRYSPYNPDADEFVHAKVEDFTERYYGNNFYISRHNQMVEYRFAKIGDSNLYCAHYHNTPCHTENIKRLRERFKHNSWTYGGGYTEKEIYDWLSNQFGDKTIEELVEMKALYKLNKYLMNGRKIS